MILALDVVWASEGSVLKLRRPLNDAVATQFLIRVNTLNLGGLSRLWPVEFRQWRKTGQQRRPTL